MSRSNARQDKSKSHISGYSHINLVAVYNPIIKNLQTIIRNNFPILYSDPEMQNIFPEGSINVTYRKVERTYFSINVS